STCLFWEVVGDNFKNMFYNIWLKLLVLILSSILWNSLTTILDLFWKHNTVAATAYRTYIDQGKKNCADINRYLDACIIETMARLVEHEDLLEKMGLGENSKAICILYVNMVHDIYYIPTIQIQIGQQISKL
ncbi:hypothetical protein ACJX0J_040247, partial [Zea mays]